MEGMDTKVANIIQMKVEQIDIGDNVGRERSQLVRPQSCPLRYDTKRIMQLRIMDATPTSTVEHEIFKKS